MTLKNTLDDLRFVVGQQDTDTKALYDRAAARYDHFRELWLSIAGEQTEKAMVDRIREVIKPGHRVLDAGAGTGGLSRRILDIQPDVELTMLDQSEAMLAHAKDLAGRRVIGDVQELPFDDNTFDIIVSGWVIETVPSPKKAVTEMLRVLSEDGYLLYTFCSLQNGWLSRVGTALLRSAVKRGFGGKFLSAQEIPWHDCEHSRIAEFHKGLSTLVVLRKCCRVDGAVLPKVKGIDSTVLFSEE